MRQPSGPTLDKRRPARDAGSAPLWRLLTALALPAGLGAVGVFGLGNLSATFFLYAVGGCVLAPWLLVGARPLTSRGGLPFAPSSPNTWRTELGLAVVFGPVFLALYALARPWLGAIGDYQARATALGLDLREPGAALVAFAIFNPWLEEWWWRGHATPRCCSAFGRRGGVALVTAGFGAWHLVLLLALFPWPLALLRVGLITAASMLWSHLAMAHGSWRMTYIAHLAADLAMVVLFVKVIVLG